MNHKPEALEYATFIGDKTEYFKQFLTDEEREPKAWKKILSDMRHSVEDAGR